MKNERILLIHETITQDDDGFEVVTRDTSKVWAQIKSVKRSEFYMAANSNTKVSDVIVMNYIDYDLFKKKYGKPNKVLIDGEEFKIIRPYYDSARDRNTIELTVVGVEE